MKLEVIGKMTDKEFYDKLQGLESKMLTFNESGGGSLSATEIALLKELYPKLKEMSKGYISTKFNSGCGSCVRTTFQIYSSVYFRLKEEFKDE